MGFAEKGAGIIEIGSGIGVLTKELALRANKVVCIEIDSRLLPVLDETLSEFDNIKIINEDVLKVDLHKLIKDEFDGLKVSICANLPYYITSPILMSLLKAKLPIKAITVMVQKEAAERICAKETTNDFGAISAAVRYYCDPEILFHVSKGSFMPAPQVDSTVIRLNILPSPRVNPTDEEFFFEVIKGAFSQRRKTLLNSLCAYFKLDKAKTSEMLNQIGIDVKIRPEKLTLEDFLKISDTIKRQGDLSEKK
jgi:16S rRNA (adenine1518-N6/adenine1519-N6)-dimethyltransferase